MTERAAIGAAVAGAESSSTGLVDQTIVPATGQPTALVLVIFPSFLG